MQSSGMDCPGLLGGLNVRTRCKSWHDLGETVGTRESLMQAVTLARTWVREALLHLCLPMDRSRSGPGDGQSMRHNVPLAFYHDPCGRRRSRGDRASRESVPIRLQTLA